jgi:glycosyltransferase involved in cell wall biosynthesis
MTVRAGAEVVTPISRGAVAVVGNAQSVHVRARAAALQTLGYQVTLITSQKVEGVACLQASLEDYVVPTKRWGKLGARIAKLRAVVSIFARHRGEATHIHYAQGLWAGLGFILGARPLIVTVMGGDILFGEQVSSSWADRALTKLLLRNADLVTAKSEHLARVVRSFGVSERKVMVLYWGVDTAAFRPIDGVPLRRKLGLSPDDLVLLSPRFLKPLYNVHNIVEALPLIRARGHKARLLVIDYGAEPAYRAQVLRRAGELGLAEDVILLPPRPREQMPEIYAASDVVVSVPSSDGMPMTVLEAMACGKPTVVTDLQHYRELFLDGENVITCSTTAEGIAQAVGRLATQPELTSRLVENALKTVAERADLRSELARLNERLVEIVDGHRRRQPLAVRVLAFLLLVLAALQQAVRSSLKASPRAV